MPVIVTVNVPATVPVHDSVAVPEPPVIVFGVTVHVRPAGDTAVVRLTVPVKPLTGAMVIVDVPEDPAMIVILVGLAVIVKSGAAVTVNVTVVL